MPPAASARARRACLAGRHGALGQVAREHAAVLQPLRVDGIQRLCTARALNKILNRIAGKRRPTCAR
jgi:hypothetical protein